MRCAPALALCVYFFRSFAFCVCERGPAVAWVAGVGACTSQHASSRWRACPCVCVCLVSFSSCRNNAGGLLAATNQFGMNIYPQLLLDGLQVCWGAPRCPTLCRPQSEHQIRTRRSVSIYRIYARPGKGRQLPPFALPISLYARLVAVGANSNPNFPVSLPLSLCV